jgi:5'-3' exonuclease
VVRAHLVDGTYELFRAWFGAPPAQDPTGREVGATRGLLSSLNALVRDENVTHIAVAFDHVVESFRNQLYDGYKTGEGLPEELLTQFELAERAARALGMVVWPMVDFEADDALSTAARRLSADPRVEQIVICSPDKDLAQCVEGERIVCFDRVRRRITDEAGVHARFGVAPSSIPDYLALVGDDADGIPGVPRWGAKSAAALLARYGHVDAIPDDPNDWDVRVRGAAALAQSLVEHREDARLFVRLATLRYDAPANESLDEIEWKGAHRSALEALCAELGETGLPSRVVRWRD